MSFTRPLRCAYALAKPSRSIYGVSNSFHSSNQYQKDEHKSPARRRLTTSLIDPKESTREEALKEVPQYTAAEREILKQKYNPEQIAVIETGEEAIDPSDILNQGALRNDSMALKYLDDFSKIDPVLDYQRAAPEENYDPDIRFKTGEEIAGDLSEWLDKLPEDADKVEWAKFMDNTRLMVGKAEAELDSTNFEAPELPKLTDPVVRRQVRAMRNKGGNEFEQHFERLSKQTGMSLQFLKRLRYKVLVHHRVVNQTRLGKISSMYYLTVAGNGDGLLGIGEGKNTEGEQGMRESVLKAFRNLTPIPRYENRTIYGDVKGKVGATELELYTRPPGFGIRCQDKIYEMCKCAGISDLGARVTRARNPMNTVKAAFQALLSQRLPEDVARARGKKMVDVRKVYYAGNV